MTTHLPRPTRLRATLLAGAVLIATGPLVATAMAKPPAPTRAAATNWNRTVARTAEGGHLLGNPAAAVKLVEFVSYTCPHCARFEQESADQLRLGFVAQGKGSIEVRNFVRDPVDLTVALLTNCGPKEKFFVNHTVFLRSQDTWMQPLSRMSPAQQQRWFTGNLATRVRFIASDFHFYDIMRTLGYDRTAVDRCLANTALAEQLAKQTQSDSDKYGVEGTPSFMVDGILLAGTHDWRSLRPQLEVRTR